MQENNEQCKTGKITIPQVRLMLPEDYPQIYALWKRIKGMGIRSIDDEEEAIKRFIKRNPTTSFVAQAENIIVGNLLCGHDGRRGCFYHVCVDEKYRNHGIATKMVNCALEVLRKEKISRVNLMAFLDNKIGNHYWQNLGWDVKENVNLYELNLNEQNITVFNK